MIFGLYKLTLYNDNNNNDNNNNNNNNNNNEISLPWASEVHRVI